MNNNDPYSTKATEQYTTPKKRVRWFFIASLFAVPIFILLLAIFVFRVAWTIRENSGREAFYIELAKLEEEGIPVDNASLAESYRSRTSNQLSENWDLVLNALRSIEFTERCRGVPILDRQVIVDEFAEDFDITENWPHREPCVRFAEEQAQLIEFARRAATETQPVFFPIVFQSIETLLQEVQDVRSIAWILRTDAQVAIYQNDHDRAFRDIIALFELAKHVDYVPSFVSRLVGIAVRRLASQSLQVAIQHNILNEEQLRVLDGKLVTFSNIDDRWKSLMIDELAMNLPVFIRPNIATRSKVEIPARGRDGVCFIGIMRKAISFQSDDWVQLHESAMNLDSERDRTFQGFKNSIDNMLTALLTPAFKSSAEALINDAQLHRQARVAIALRLYQLRTGTLPSQLEELPVQCRELTTYGKAPFGYIRSDNEAVLWGFILTDKTRQITSLPPDTTQLVAASLDNRRVIWKLEH